MSSLSFFTDLTNHGSPGLYYNPVSGVAYPEDMAVIQMLRGDAEGEHTAGITLPDTYRLPQFRDNGETIAISPIRLEAWTDNGLEFHEVSMWYIASHEPAWREAGAEPVSESTDLSQPTPIDLVGDRPHTALLHEVRWPISTF